MAAAGIAYEVLPQLVGLSNQLGVEDRALVLLGEGNTSAACEDGTFWVKASGAELRTANEASFSRVSLRAVLDLLEAEGASDDDVTKQLHDMAEAGGQPRPSTETFFHAVCLNAGAKWVAHTHPVSVNSVLCSQAGAQLFTRHLFPEAVVVCGRWPVIVPYSDPGVDLSRAIARGVAQHVAEHAEYPKLLLLENHGMVALGRTAREALNITLITDKWARILLGAHSLGGPRYLPEGEAERIDTRPDEGYRRQRLAD